MSKSTVFSKFLLVTFAFFPLASCWPIFNGKGGVNGTVEPVIRSCVSKFPDEAHHCYAILDCVTEHIEPAIAQRWSAGASILAFVPTILVLMSNSIDEILDVAEDSSVLAILLCLSSVTPFSSRFGFKPIKSPRNNRESHEAKAQNLWNDIEDRWCCQKQGASKWWQLRYAFMFGLYALLLSLSMAVWYFMIDVTRFGIVVFACKVKSNALIWASATQVLGILNVLCRHHLYDTEYIQCSLLLTSEHAPTIDEIKYNIHRAFSTASALDPTCVQPVRRSNVHTSLSKTDFENVVIILRAPRPTNTRWTLQVITAVLSYALFAYGTVVFASMTLYVASDAIRVMFAVTASAGTGRFVVSLLGRTSIHGKRVILVDIPKEDSEMLAVTIRETIKNLVG